MHKWIGYPVAALALLLVATPSTGMAFGLFPWFCNGCSDWCHQRVCACGSACPAPACAVRLPVAPIIPVAPSCAPPPVVVPSYNTSWREENYVTERNVTVNEYREESYVRRVPKVRYEEVTVDEGGYKMVWVPKPTQRQVARTEWEEELAYRTVATPVTRRVAETRKRFVPQTTLTYNTIQPRMAFRSGCSTCDQAAPLTVSTLPTIPHAYSSVPVIPDARSAYREVRPSRPVLGTPEFREASEDPYSDWSEVPTRRSARHDHDHTTEATPMSHESAYHSTPRRTGSRLFVPVDRNQLARSRYETVR